MALTRNEIRKRLSVFAKKQQGKTNERSQAQTFWLRFYECFGILCNTIHNVWMRYTCGRLKSDYRYFNTIIYNNFPWPELPSPAGGGRAGDEGLATAAAASADPHPKSLSRLRARDLIENAAQATLDARALYPESNLADLYDPLAMPSELVKAHAALDKTVDAAYPYKGGKDDAARVAFLFERYQQLSSLLPVVATKKKRTKLEVN